MANGKNILEAQINKDIVLIPRCLVKYKLTDTKVKRRNAM